MDYLRSCYQSNMRPFRDEPEIEVAGRWYWCQPGAQALPIQHLYGSVNWDDDSTDVESITLGETGRGAWYSGESDPLLKGRRFCGPADWWLNGSPIEAQGTPLPDEQGIPPCCRGPEVPEDETVRMRELDNTPDIPFVAELRIDQASGLVLTHPGPNVAQLSVVHPPSPGGTVTSVGLAPPAEMSVGNSPITGAGTIILAWDNQFPNLCLLSPLGGGAGQPAFRPIDGDDLASQIIVAATHLQVAVSSCSVLGQGNVSGQVRYTHVTTSTPGHVLTAVDVAGTLFPVWQAPTAGGISDFNEAVDDRVAALLVAGTNITLTYNDGSHTLTIDAAGGGGSPGGASGDVQYQDGGVFAGNSAFTFNPTSKEVIVTDGTLVATLNATTSNSAGHFTDGTRTVRLADTTRCILATDGTRTTQVNSSTANLLCLGGGGTVVLGSVAHAAVFTGNTRINGHLETDQTSAAATPGTVVGKMPIYDASGTLVGYVPIFDSIT